MDRQLNRLKILALGLLLGLPFSSFAMTHAAGETVTQRDAVNDDYYAAGSKVDVDADIAGDLVVAGGDLFIGNRVQADVIAAGGSIDLRGEVADDVRVAGGEITIDANIGDDLVAAGGEIRVTSGTSVGGDAWLAGGEVTMDGTINKDLMVGGGTIQIGGTIHGNVTIEGGELHILKNALIDGNLLYKGPHKATINPDAKIVGTVTYEKSEWDHGERGYGIFFLGTMLAASIVLFLLFPGFTVSAARRISVQPWQSLGLGLILLIVTPIIAILFISIVLGVWVGLIIIALYLVALPIGFLISCFFLGDWGARLLRKEVSTKGRRILSVALVMILLGLIQLIPVFGGLLFFVLLLLGLGSAMLQIHNVYNQPAAS
jgi:cytoskeletal protein CcmA (bactofilin family)